MEKKPDYTTGNTAGPTRKKGGQNTAGKSKPARAGNASDSFTSAREILAVLQDDLNQYNGIAAVRIVTHNGNLIIVLSPPDGGKIGWNADHGNITINGRAVMDD